jgi:hypothetical protein
VAVPALFHPNSPRCGRLDPTRFNLGTAGFAISAVATVWLVFEFINIAWPRTASLPWYENWAMVVGTVILGAVGGAYYLATRPDRKLAATGVSGPTLDAAAVGNRPGPAAVEPQADSESLV